jgi:hypothetical protein
LWILRRAHHERLFTNSGQLFVIACQSQTARYAATKSRLWRYLAMVKFVIAALIILLPASALAQTAIQTVPPPPGTIEDPKAPIRLIADGPPRSLIRIGLPDRAANIVADLKPARAAR